MRKTFTLFWFLWPFALLLLLISFPFPQAHLESKQTMKSFQQREGAHQGKVGRYRFAYAKVNDLNGLEILNNHDKTDGAELIRNHRCQIAMNGGFYDEEYHPLGLVIIDEEKIAGEIESSLLNGYFSVSSEGEPLINQNKVSNSVRLALQGGPLLLDEGRPLFLVIRNDEYKRRSVVATTTEGKVLFLTFYDEQSVFLGPKLGELPDVVEKFAAREKLQLESALNLDGGSTSLFRSGNFFLGEYRTVRTLLCVRN